MFPYKIEVREIEYYIEMYENIIDKMRDKEKKKKLKDICEKLKERYQDYIDNSSCLENITEDGQCQKLKKELNDCYKNNARVIAAEVNKIVEEQEIQIQSLCPLCEVDHHNEKEHYLPKTEFPEYSIFIPNITPVCTTCNLKKSSKFIDNERERQFFNIYFDRIPSKKILKAKVMFLDKIPIVEFELLEEALKENLTEKERKVIKNHFKNLDLLKRYEKEATDVIYQDIIIIKSLMLQMKQEDIKKFCKNCIVEKNQIYGLNYWKNVLEQAILEDQFEAFYDFCQEYENNI